MTVIKYKEESTTGSKIVSFAENPELCAAIEKAYGIKVWPVNAPIGFISEHGVDGNEGNRYLCRSLKVGILALELMQDMEAKHPDIDAGLEVFPLLIQEAFDSAENIPNPFMGYMFYILPMTVDEESFQPVRHVVLRYGVLDDKT